jgi:hypothetical protein
MDEKDFIQNNASKDPYPLFIYFAFMLLLIGGLLFVRSCERSVRQQQQATYPALQVTNRDFQLFLWQHPHFMRLHVKKKSGYLTAFSPIGRGELDPDLAHKWVRAPPELLYRYHRWKRLIDAVIFPRSWSREEWSAFFADNPAWQEEKEGIKLQQAILGWTNYYLEGDTINEFPIRYAEVLGLVAKYPGFSPDQWQDLNPNYELKGVGVVPTGTLPSFVRVAIFNQQAAATLPQ